ncbi:MAG: DUF1795 domain-containing protein [Chloroflexota bacterium]|nr:DUF1795 domain-containing protein [Chloroflexota bacterium]
MQRYKQEIGGQLPEGWLVGKESIMFLEPNGEANVIASSEPLGTGIDTKQYAELQGDLLRKDFEGYVYVETVFEQVEVWGGKQGYLRRFQWEPPDNVPVTQIQIYYVENGRGYTATATVPSKYEERFELQLRLILGALTIESQPTATPAGD